MNPDKIFENGFKNFVSKEKNNADEMDGSTDDEEIIVHKIETKQEQKSKNNNSVKLKIEQNSNSISKKKKLNDTIQKMLSSQKISWEESEEEPEKIEIVKPKKAKKSRATKVPKSFTKYVERTLCHKLDEKSNGVDKDRFEFAVQIHYNIADKSISKLVSSVFRFDKLKTTREFDSNQTCSITGNILTRETSIRVEFINQDEKRVFFIEQPWLCVIRDLFYFDKFATVVREKFECLDERLKKKQARKLIKENPSKLLMLNEEYMQIKSDLIDVFQLSDEFDIQYALKELNV